MCPTCGHSLEGVSRDIYHCPRCGTIVSGDGFDVYVPVLVLRCRDFAETVLMGKSSKTVPGWEFRLEEWRRIGIAESIAPHGERVGT